MLFVNDVAQDNKMINPGSILENWWLRVKIQWLNSMSTTKIFVPGESGKAWVYRTWTFQGQQLQFRLIVDIFYSRSWPSYGIILGFHPQRHKQVKCIGRTILTPSVFRDEPLISFMHAFRSSQSTQSFNTLGPFFVVNYNYYYWIIYFSVVTESFQEGLLEN